MQQRHMTGGKPGHAQPRPERLRLGAASILLHIEGATIGPDKAVRSCGYDPVMRP
jgi:hypothetical protein